VKFTEQSAILRQGDVFLAVKESAGAKKAFPESKQRGSF
jgi:hypothetical protein